MKTLRANVLVSRKKRWLRADTFRVLVIDLAATYDFPSKQAAADFVAKHLPGNVCEWRTAK